MRVLPSLVLVTIVLASCGDGSTNPGSSSGAAASLAIETGNNQEATPSTTVSVVPAVVVRDAAGEPVSGTLISFTIEAGGGVVERDTARSGADGIARAGAWRLGPLPADNRLRATSGSLPAVIFTAVSRFQVPVTLITGSVGLSEGTTVQPASLRVVSAITDVPVNQAGGFTAVAAPSGLHLAAVHAANGRPILFGWFDAQHKVFNVHTTAEVLAFFDLGGYTLRELQKRQELREFLAGANLGVLEAAIIAALRADPAAITLDAPTVRAARSTLIASMAGSTALGMIIDPPGTRKSGVNVDEVGFRNITLTNHYRRRVAAFVDRVDIRDANGQLQPRPLNQATTKLSAVSYATSVLGTIAELISGGMPTVPVVSEPIATPLFPDDALATHYRVTVLGPGNGVFNPTSLPAEQRRPYLEAAFGTWILEIMLPMMDQILALDNDARLARGEPERESILHTFLDVNPASALEALAEGDIPKMMDEIRKTLFDSGFYQEAVVDLVLGGFKNVWNVPEEAVLERVEEWGKLFTRIEIAATTYAVSKSIWEIYNSKQVEQWDVTVSPANVTLTPPSAQILPTGTQLLTVTVTDATGGGPTPVFHYDWSTTGNFGKIVNATHPQPATSFTSSSNLVTYVADPNKEGIDEVRVRVTIEIFGQVFAIGETKATVSTLTAKVRLDPAQLTLTAKQIGTLSADVDPRLLDGGNLSYRWTTPGAFGKFPANTNGVESATQTSIQYTAKSFVDGTEPVTLEVFSTFNAIKRLLGSATASVEVQRTPFTLTPAVVSASRDTLVNFIARPNGDIPAQPKFVWNFGDGSALVTVLNDSVTAHTFNGVGDYQVSVEMQDAMTGQRLAVAGSTVSIGGLMLAQVSAGAYHSCGLTAAGSAWCWGRNQFGQVGDGTTVPITVNRLRPVQVLGGHVFSQIVVGHEHTCGLTQAGAVLCWGRNTWGQVGLGTAENGPHPFPAPVLGLPPIASVSAGQLHTCARNAAGQAWCWGHNDNGTIGDGTLVHRAQPVQVQGGINFAQISAGFDRTCGVTPSGTAYCWGNNGGLTGDFGHDHHEDPPGVLGVGSIVPLIPQPTQVSGSTQWAEVTAGFRFACGRTTAGTLSCWGANRWGSTTIQANRGGQLGNGTRVSTTQPGPTLIGAETFTSVMSGPNGACALSTVGEAWCWGSNFYGEVGDGGPADFFNTVDYITPIRVVGGHTFSSLSVGYTLACGVKQNGEAWCWGGNFNGGLGDGTTVSSATPVRVRP